jgi:hypothetical protein
MDCIYIHDTPKKSDVMDAVAFLVKSGADVSGAARLFSSCALPLLDDCARLQLPAWLITNKTFSKVRSVLLVIRS